MRLAAAGVLGLALALALEQSRSPSVPGANDNASGVAALLEVVRQLDAERPDGLEVMLVVPGCEESGMGGMAAWLDGPGARLEREATLVVGLDTVGSGEPIVLTGEAGLWPVRYDAADVRLAIEAARADGVGAASLADRRLDGSGPRAPARPSQRLAPVGPRRRLSRTTTFRAICPEAVDIGCVRDCVRATVAIAREFAA